MIVGMITAPRNGVSYINESLISYMRMCNGLPLPHIFAEPGSVIPKNYSRAKVHQNPVKLDVFFNWVNAAKWLLANSQDETIMLMEDDAKWITPFELPDADCVSFYTSKINLMYPIRDAWQEPFYGTHGLCGALALCFKRQVLIDILQHRHMVNKVCARTLDTNIGKSLLKLGYRLLLHCPTRILHLGEISTDYNPMKNEPIPIARQPYL